MIMLRPISGEVISEPKREKNQNARRNQSEVDNLDTIVVILGLDPRIQDSSFLDPRSSRG